MVFKSLMLNEVSATVELGTDSSAVPKHEVNSMPITNGQMRFIVVLFIAFGLYNIFKLQS